ncbi:MAG TPA: DEAD/DEAH box helicase [Pseudolabrys sp.]
MYEYDVPVEEHIELPQSPNKLFSLAVGLLGDAAAAIADTAAVSVRDQVQPATLTFAATFFDAYLQSQLDDFANGEFPILASASYYLGGNPGSSKVLINQAEPPEPTLGAGLALLTYRLLRGEYGALPDGPYQQQGTSALSRLSAYLSGDESVEAVYAPSASIRQDAYESGDGRELLYADLITAIITKKIDAAAVTILPDASGVDIDAWRPFLSRDGFPRELWPSQQRICEAGVLSGKSALIQMPTSAGKTRATELILRSGFLADRFSLAVMVCPFRSLCHDIRSDMAYAFAGDNVAINEATDSFQEDLTLGELLAQKTILIVTPEKLLYLLRRTPELAEQIGLVVYDEGHQFDSGARGVTYELLLTSLKLLLAQDTQIILISAVIANAPRIAEWLLGDADLVVDGTGLLPTSRSIAFASWRNPLGRLEYVAPLDPDDVEFFVPRVIEKVALAPRPKQASEFPIEKNGPSVGLYLGLKLVPNGSVALFCGRKDTAANLCAAAADLFERTGEFDAPLDVSSADEVGKIATLFSREFGEATGAARSAALGIFPHHSSVPHGLRLSIEHAMKVSLVRFVVCTSTLAQGVNLPIKYLIVTGVNQGKDRILVRDFHNLIGRAGRAGMYTEGSVIFADNTIFDEKGQRSGRWRWASAKQLLDSRNSEPSASSISMMFEPFAYGQRAEQVVHIEIDQIHQLLFADDDASLAALADIARTHSPNVKPRDFVKFLHERVRIVHGIASFLLAHLDFGQDGLLERAVELAKNTLAHFLADEPTRLTIESVFRNIATSLLSGATTDEVRQAMRRSPLAPRSVEALRVWLAANADGLQAAALFGGFVGAVIPTMLQHNRHSTIIALSSQDIVPALVGAWLEGETFAAILRRMTDADIRIGGTRRRPKIEDAVALCEGGFAYEGAMVIATLADLADGMDDATRSAFKLLQRQMKSGLTTGSALGMYEVGFADREIAKDLSATFPQVTDFATARAWVRANGDLTRGLIALYPSYFGTVLDELLA